MSGYRDVADALRSGILGGLYAAGDTLPRQDAIAAEHGVNIHTVRKAVDLLAREGLVQPVRRRGTVVLGPSRVDDAVQVVRSMLDPGMPPALAQHEEDALRLVLDLLDRLREPGRGTAR